MRRFLRKVPTTSLMRLILLALLISLGSGCAKKTLVVLAPDPDGKVGSITVTGAAGSTTLDAPYQASTITGDRPGAPETLGKERSERIFAQALAIQPKAPLHFLLYFDQETSLTAESLRLIPQIRAAIAERKADEVAVVGHTDTLGSREYNLALSNRRAQAVKQLLVAQGVAAAAIRTTSHGKENPLIPTADGVNEPRNRRVEVVVK